MILDLMVFGHRDDNQVRGGPSTEQPRLISESDQSQWNIAVLENVNHAHLLYNNLQFVNM